MVTGNEQLPWLSIDIGDVYTITSVDISFHEYYGMYIEFEIMMQGLTHFLVALFVVMTSHGGIYMGQHLLR